MVSVLDCHSVCCIPLYCLWLFTLLLLLLSFSVFPLFGSNGRFLSFAGFRFSLLFRIQVILLVVAGAGFAPRNSGQDRDCISKGLSTDPILPSCVVFWWKAFALVYLGGVSSCVDRGIGLEIWLLLFSSCYVVVPVGIVIAVVCLLISGGCLSSYDF